jgi:hypothetical protein
MSTIHSHPKVIRELYVCRVGATRRARRGRVGSYWTNGVHLVVPYGGVRGVEPYITNIFEVQSLKCLWNRFKMDIDLEH